LRGKKGKAKEGKGREKGGKTFPLFGSKKKPTRKGDGGLML